MLSKDVFIVTLYETIILQHREFLYTGNETIDTRASRRVQSLPLKDPTPMVARLRRIADETVRKISEKGTVQNLDEFEGSLAPPKEGMYGLRIAENREPLKQDHIPLELYTKNAAGQEESTSLNLGSAMYAIGEPTPYGQFICRRVIVCRPGSLGSYGVRQPLPHPDLVPA